jgi:hypothetical protein
LSARFVDVANATTFHFLARRVDSDLTSTPINATFNLPFGDFALQAPARQSGGPQHGRARKAAAVEPLGQGHGHSLSFIRTDFQARSLLLHVILVGLDVLERQRNGLAVGALIVTCPSALTNSASTYVP